VFARLPVFLSIAVTLGDRRGSLHWILTNWLFQQVSCYLLKNTFLQNCDVVVLDSNQTTP
jgi:hypothetical protein